MRQEIKEIIQELHTQGFNGDELLCSLVYIASRRVGANISKINQFLEGCVPNKILSEVSWRLRGSGIWRAGRVCSETGISNNEFEKIIAINLECMAAIGLVERTYSGKTKFEKYDRYQNAFMVERQTRTP